MSVGTERSEMWGCATERRARRAVAPDSWNPRPATPEVDRRVVYEVPDEPADEPVLALVDLGGLDQLLLEGGEDPPVHHVAGALLLVRRQDEARVVGPEARGEHPRTPRPPGRKEIRCRVPGLGVRQPLHVLDRTHCLLLARVRNLRDRGHLKVWRVANAAVVAIPHREDAAVAPDGPARAGLLRHLQVLVEVDPAATAWPLVAERLRRHEVVRRLDADADVRLRGAPRQLDLVPKIVALRVVLAVVELLDASR